MSEAHFEVVKRGNRHLVAAGAVYHELPGRAIRQETPGGDDDTYDDQCHADGHGHAHRHPGHVVMHASGGDVVRHVQDYAREDEDRTGPESGTAEIVNPRRPKIYRGHRVLSGHPGEGESKMACASEVMRWSS